MKHIKKYEYFHDSVLPDGVEDKEIYAFENVRIEVEDRNPTDSIKKGLSTREYKPIIEIMNKEEYRKQLVQRALAEATYWKERHSELTELSAIFSLIKETSKKW
jgi:hypothetical protein